MTSSYLNDCVFRLHNHNPSVYCVLVKITDRTERHLHIIKLRDKARTLR